MTDIAVSAPTPPDTRADTTPDDRQAAEDMYRSAIAAGETLSGAELARRFDRPDRWGRRVVDRVRTDKPAPVTSPNGQRRTPSTPTPAKRRTPKADKGRTVAPVLAVTVAASVALVAVTCAVVSYVHLRDLALTAGLGSLSSWYPLAIDGMAISSTCSLVLDRHLERKREPLALLGLVLGLAGSLLGNLADVDPTLVDTRVVRLVLAAAPPVALAVAGHLAFRLLVGGRK